MSGLRLCLQTQLQEMVHRHTGRLTFLCRALAPDKEHSGLPFHTANFLCLRGTWRSSSSYAANIGLQHRESRPIPAAPTKTDRSSSEKFGVPVLSTHLYSQAEATGGRPGFARRDHRCRPLSLLVDLADDVTKHKG